jgi:1,4-alpha-glucan branching enzyme
MGANKVRNADGTWGVRFRVWAPNAQHVELVFSSIWNIEDPGRAPIEQTNPLERDQIAGGYIANDGTGIHPTLPTIPMIRSDEGVWETPADHQDLRDLAMIKHRLYMYRVTRDDGSSVYRTDLYSRCQAGFGANDPQGVPYDGLLGELEERVSCSVTVDPERIVRAFDVPVWPEPEEEFIPVDEFWADEFTDKPLPKRVEDLIIYELHLGALGFESDRPGTLDDAFALLDHITNLNVNAIELLPLSEFAGGAQNWGYATSHYFAIEYGGGGRDKFKHFIKECHRRGVAVIMDVVYNHYDHNADRAERYYDSPVPERDIYYWYEGQSLDYEYLRDQGWGENWFRGGYIENDSTGDAPAYHAEMVRKMFISSAVMLVEEFHIDGFRVDQTTSIHQYNRARTTNSEASNANIFGAKFLREFGRTIRLFRPGIILIAEDHSDWDEVIMPVEQGGMGFDARWYSEYYHHLSGDTHSGDKAQLLHTAALRGSETELKLEWFAGALWSSQFSKIVYNESHDEAGNSTGPFHDPTWQLGDEEHKRHTSERTINVAVNGAPLFGDTRRYAEARCRFAWGVTVLSAGTPMFLFGEEVGAEQRFKYSAVLENKEDFHGMREGNGKHMYTFYSDVNALRLTFPSLRSRNIDIVHVQDDTRVIVFRRWNNEESFLIFASLADQPFAHGYVVNNNRIESGMWTEVFNSDSARYGGDNVGNGGQAITCTDGRIQAVIPFAGFVVFAHERNCTT